MLKQETFMQKYLHKVQSIHPLAAKGLQKERDGQNYCKNNTSSKLKIKISYRSFSSLNILEEANNTYLSSIGVEYFTQSHLFKKTKRPLTSGGILVPNYELSRKGRFSVPALRRNQYAMACNLDDKGPSREVCTYG